MSCKYYQKLLYLNRPGERSARQSKKLGQHVARCSICAQEKLEIEKASDYVALARETRPEIAAPGVLTADIMRSIRLMNNFPQRSWLDFLSLPRTRLALIGMTAVLVGAFFLQEFLVLYRVSRLENKMARESRKQTVFAETRSNKFQISPIRLLEESEFLKGFKINETESGEDRILLKKSTLNAWLETYRKLQQENRFLLRYFQEKFPELEGISIDDGLDLEEIEKLIKSKKKIMEHFYRL